MNNEAELLAKKMNLESQWNLSFLENGLETFNMHVIEQKLKEVKRQIRDLTLLKISMGHIISDEEKIDESGC